MRRFTLLIALITLAGCSPKNRPGGPIFDDSSRRSVSLSPATQPVAPIRLAAN